MSTEQRADDDVVPGVAGGGFDAVLWVVACSWDIGGLAGRGREHRRCRRTCPGWCG